MTGQATDNPVALADISVQAVMDKLPTAMSIACDECKHLIEAEVYGDSIKMRLLSQKTWVKVLSPEYFRNEVKYRLKKHWSSMNFKNSTGEFEMKKKKITEGIAEITAKSFEKAKGVATEFTNKTSKLSREKMAAINKDTDELVDWVVHRNSELQQECENFEQTKYEDLPVLGKVIFRGEEGINELPTEERNRYTEYFKKNISRIAVLTAVNPLFGLGALGAEAAATGLASAKAGVETAAVGAGLVGVSTIASTLAPVSYFVWSALKVAVPALRIAGIGLLALGAGAALFKSIEALPLGKKIIAAFDQTQKLYYKCDFQYRENFEKMSNMLSQKIQSAAEKLRETSKKIAITIDDAVHSDQNLRIMQYQEIIFDLYKSQAEIRETLSKLVEEYNTLKTKNDLLSKKMMEYEAHMQALTCGSEYIQSKVGG